MAPLNQTANLIGFRGAKWGDNIKKLKNLEFIYKGEDLIFDGNKHEATNLKPKLGRAIISSNYYCFINNKLASVVLYFYGSDNVDIVKNLAKLKFGHDYSTGNKMITWYGEKSVVGIMADENKAVFMFMSTIALKKNTKDTNDADIKATETDF